MELRVNTNDSTIDIHVDKVPIIKILAEVSQEASIPVYADESVTELATLTLQGVSLEEFFKKLLANHEYSLTFTKTETGNFAVSEVYIVDGQGAKTSTLKNIPSSSPPDDHKLTFFTYTKDDLTKDLGSFSDLAKMMTVEKVQGEQGEAGIKVKTILKGSFINRIGVKNGDIIKDINGRSITSKRHFYEAIKSVAFAGASYSTLKIDRITDQNLIEPIYINIK